MAETNVSVCMAVHNGVPYLEDQLKSILSQLNVNDEIIISDDGSIDGSIEFIKNLKDSRIKLLSYKNKIIPNNVFNLISIIKNNFENAIKHSKNDIIILSDQDDVWLPNKVEVIKNHFAKGTKGILHNCNLTSKNITFIENTMFAKSSPSKNFIEIIYKPNFMGCCMAFHREYLNNLLPFPNLPIEYDTWIFLNIFNSTNFKFIQQPLINYRRHGGNSSSCSEKSTNSLWVKVKRRFYILLGYGIILKRKLLS